MTEKLLAYGSLWRHAVAAVCNPRRAKATGVLLLVLALGIAGLTLSSGIDTATPLASSSAAAVETLIPTANAAPDCTNDTWPYRDVNCADASAMREMRSIRLISTDKGAPSTIKTGVAPNTPIRTAPIGPTAAVVGVASPPGGLQPPTIKPTDKQATARSGKGKMKVVRVPQEEPSSTGGIDQDSLTPELGYAAADPRRKSAKISRQSYRDVNVQPIRRDFMQMRDERTP